MDSDQPSVASLACAECGVSLPAGVEVCDQCSPPAPRTLGQVQPAETLLRRAKGQLLVGTIFAPILFAPLALQNAMKAQRALRESDCPDVGLLASAYRLRVAATAVTVLAYGLLALIAWNLSAGGSAP